MDPAINLYSIFLLLGAAHGVFLSFALLITKNGDPVGCRILASLTLLFAIDLGIEFLEQTRYLLYAPQILIIYINIDYLFGPLTYLYVRALTQPTELKSSTRLWLHFLPFVIGLIISIPLVLMPQEQIADLVYSSVDSLNPQQVLVQILILFIAISSMIQIGIYLFLSIHDLYQHHHRIENEFSYLERISLTWLRNLLIALALLYLSYLVEVLLILFLENYDETIGVHYPLIVILIYAMGYMGLRQPTIFTRQDLKREHVERTSDRDDGSDTGDDQQAKYRKSALDRETSSILFDELKHHMKEHRPHLDSTLSLSQLASRLSLSANYLSQIINEQAGQHFFDFINAYRVESAKQALTVSNQYGNILNIALDAGFNSKSAFYNAFKRHTGLTPSQFRQQQQSS